MQRINGNDIILTRGDTLAFLVSLKQGSQTYTPAADDVIRFAVSRGYAGEVAYKLMAEATIDNGTLVVSLTSEQTKLLDYRTYNYDIQITHGDGTVDTVISGKLTITGEVK